MEITKMKKTTVFIASLLVSLSLCSCSGSEAPATSSAAHSSVSQEVSLPEIPDDIKCTEIHVYGKDKEVSDEISEKLVSILRNSYKTEVNDLDLGIGICMEVKFSNGMIMIFEANEEPYAYYKYSDENEGKIVSISKDEAKYIYSLYNELETQ